MIGALEAGGTKCVCAVFELDGTLIERVSIPTTTPDETMPAMIDFFKQYPAIQAIGVGSFGPIGVNPKLDNYGYITSTPKLAWQHYNFLGSLKAALNVPMAWTTDVNAAAYGELKQGAAQGLSNVVYLTVGTGIGGGFVVNGQVVSGYGHPESGHVLVRRHPEDTYEGKCPFHRDCLEGMAAGPAIEERWGKKAAELADNDKVWELEAYYIAQALYNYFLTLSPEKFVLGGGVMKQRQVFPLIKQYMQEMNQGYVELPPMDDFIVPPALEDNAGIVGCFELAKELLA